MASTTTEDVLELVAERVEKMTLAEKLTIIDGDQGLKNISLNQALYYADELCQDVLLEKFIDNLKETHHDSRRHYVPQVESN